MKKRHLLLIGFIILLGCWLLKPVRPQQLPVGSDSLKYDSSLWMNEEDSSRPPKEGITTRQKMLKDAVNSLPNKTREEIVQLLGKPTETDKYKNSDKFLVYVLGLERGNYFSNIDYEWLFIYLKDNKFDTYSIHTD